MKHALVALALALAGGSSVGACGGEKQISLAEALNTDANKKFEDSADYKPNPKPRPQGHLPPPSTAEFKAWDRKDPEGEKHLYKWDKRNVDRMETYFEEIRCFRDKVKVAGQAAWGAEPQSPKEEQWYQFKRQFIPFINRWQQRLFANEPRILEKSKFIGHFLEAHELVMKQYPQAFNEADDLQVKKADAHWMVVEDKVHRYMDALKHKPLSWNLESAKGLKKYEAFCTKAFIEPDEGPKKQKGKKSPI
ncbi:MAG: hypothetical protein V3V08_12110 [Nannocystaceae bacterium]